MAARRGAKKKSVRKATGKRPATRRAVAARPKPARKKPAPARAAARPPKKAARKRAAAAPVKKAAKKRVAAKPAKKAVAPRAATKPAKRPARPARRAVASRPAAAAAFTPAFQPQRQVANPKELLLFELQRGRVAVMAAIQGLTAPGADRPIAPGKWSVREIVLHLIVRDRVRLDEFEAALGGRPASWTGLDEQAMARVNELHLGPLRPLSWEEAVRLLQSTREQLVHALLSVPAHPAELWTEAHPFGAMLHALPRHDRHHAEQIKLARIEG